MGRGGRRDAARIGVIATLLVISGTGCASAVPGADGAPRTDARSASAAPSLTIGATSMPLAGRVPFLDVTTEPDDPRVLVVQADLDRTVGISCVRTVNRPIVRETSRTVSVTIAAYGVQPEPGTGCDGEGDREAIRIRLASPLGGRALVDGTTGRRRPVLDPTTVPTLSAVPASYVAEPLRWDDRNGRATRRWHLGERSVWLVVGRLERIEAGAPLPSGTGRPVSIGPTVGTVWHGGGPYDVVVVRWSLRDGRSAEIRTVEERPSRGSVERAVALARAVR